MLKRTATARTLFAPMYIRSEDSIYSMKHLVDLDEEALAHARLALGTHTIKDTVNQALRAAAQHSTRQEWIDDALSRLAAMNLSDDDRASAWR